MGCSSSDEIKNVKRKELEKLIKEKEERLKLEQKKEMEKELNEKMNKEKEIIRKDLNKNKIEKEKNIIKQIEESKKQKERIEESTKKLEIQKKEEENNLKKYESKIRIEQNESLLLKIKSKYICDLIFDFVKKKESFKFFNLKLKLFYYSKALQKKFNLDLINYQFSYYSKLDMQPIKYFYNPIGDGVKVNRQFEEDLKKNKIDKNEYILFVNNYWKLCGGMEKKNIFPIKIYSPLVRSLSKTEHFDYYQIEITSSPEAKNDFIFLFNNLNSMNLNYPEILLNFSSPDDMNKIKEYKINFNKISRLIVHENCSETNILYKNLFSFFTIYNKLELLELRNTNNQIDSSIIENVNKFKSLKFLSLSEFQFENIVILKLYDLEDLKLSNCKNIAFDENEIYNIKLLNITNSKIIIPRIPLKFPKLEDFEINKDINIKQFFDLSSLGSLKKVNCDTSIFLEIPGNSLENVIFTGSENSLEIKEKILKKLLNIKTLKTLHLFEINEEILSKIEGQYLSITTLRVYKPIKKQEDLFDIQNKFPNINKFIFQSDLIMSNNDNIEIIENSNFKVKEIDISYTGNIKLYCNSFENITELIIMLNEVKDINTVFPFINDKIIFKSLKFYYFNYLKLFDNENIDKLYNLLERMPNLEILNLHLQMNSISEQLYIKLIRKILSKKVQNISITIFKPNFIFNGGSLYLTRDELKKIYPEINFADYISIIITKNLSNL